MADTQAKPLALIIDDERSICESLSGVLTDEGWHAKVAFSGPAGIQIFKKASPDVVFVDVWMPQMDGIETLQRLKELDDTVPVIVMSGHGNIETAVKATKGGALNFLEKPLSLENILPLLNHALSLRQKSKSNTLITPTIDKAHSLMGECPQIADIRSQILKVAPRDAWALITGENGTGKEVVARALHAESQRADKPFIAVNCAAIPENLIESELFGHVKGAFTNAISHKVGKFELANKGTIFLDEIADMSLKTQAKVLRILESQELQRVGDTQDIKVDVRVIAATNKDLVHAIEAGQFREDLFYRLNVIPFMLPPLRERGNDVLLLLDFFSKKTSLNMGEPEKSFSGEAKEAFKRYEWPGNVRELRNLVERLYILVSENLVQLNHLPPSIQSSEDFGEWAQSGDTSGTGTTLRDARSEFERIFILQKLKEHNWNISKTAESIGLERSNLHRKLKLYKIDSKQSKNQ